MMMGAKQTSTDPHSKLIIDWLHTFRVYNTNYQMIYIYVTQAMLTCNYGRLIDGKFLNALIASIDSIKWIIFSYNYIDFLIVSKGSENGQISRLQTVLSKRTNL